MSVVRPEEFKHGLRCMDCDDPIVEGQAYSERLTAMVHDDAVVELICVPCELKVLA